MVITFAYFAHFQHLCLFIIDYEYRIPKDTGSKTFPLCIQPEITEQDYRGSKQPIMEYSSCLNPNGSTAQSEYGPVLHLSQSAAITGAYTHGLTGFRHPILPYQTRASQTKQGPKHTYRASISLMKAAKKSGGI